MIDAVVKELFERRAIGSDRNKTEVTKRVRKEIYMAAYMATVAAANQFERGPRRRHLVRRLFEDLRHIQMRIERNKDLDGADLDLAMFPVRQHALPPDRRANDGIRYLQATLQHRQSNLRVPAASRIHAAEFGNHDRFTEVFINDVFELWCDLLWFEASADKSRLFNRFLVAAWRDVGFPFDEKSGRSLETWLADRVRKQFAEGVPARRVERQNYEFESMLVKAGIR